VVFLSLRDGFERKCTEVLSESSPGQSVPLATIPASYDEAMKSLAEARRHADDLLVYDNTPNGKGHRLVARFIAGELVKATQASPEWLKNVFGQELRDESKQQEKSARER
jgi:hypothetical protein